MISLLQSLNWPDGGQLKYSRQTGLPDNGCKHQTTLARHTVGSLNKSDQLSLMLKVVEKPQLLKSSGIFFVMYFKTKISFSNCSLHKALKDFR